MSIIAVLAADELDTASSIPSVISPLSLTVGNTLRMSTKTTPSTMLISIAASMRESGEALVASLGITPAPGIGLTHLMGMDGRYGRDLR